MTAWVIDTLIGVTLLMLLVLVLRRPVARLFGAQWAYALWLLPLARLLLPPPSLFQAPVGEAPSHALIIIPSAAAAAAPAVTSGPLQWAPYLLALWLSGAIIFALWQQASYSAFLLSLGEGRPANPERHGGVKVVESLAVDGPLAIGLLNRRIVVPLDFETRYSPAERRLALDHELIHHRRGDLWWNLAALAMLGLNWFNPLAWIAFRAFRADQELACDAAVACRHSLSDRHDYARALVKSACRPGQIAACALNGADQLKQRLRMMKEHRASRARTVGGIAALAALATAGLTLGGPGFARQAPASEPAELIVVESDGADPVIDARDVATLAAKCGPASWEGRLSFRLGSLGEGPGTVMCGNGKAVEDAEVDAIVARTVERARARAAAPKRPAAPIPAPAPAHPAVEVQALVSPQEERIHAIVEGTRARTEEIVARRIGLSRAERHRRPPVAARVSAPPAPPIPAVPPPPPILHGAGWMKPDVPDRAAVMAAVERSRLPFQAQQRAVIEAALSEARVHVELANMEAAAARAAAPGATLRVLRIKRNHGAAEAHVETEEEN